MNEKKVPGVVLPDMHLPAAIEHHRGDRAASQHLHDRRADGSDAQRPVVQVEQPLDQRAGAGRFVGLAAIGLDLAHALEGLLELAGQLGGVRLGLPA